ncbi:MAG: hypothetical protein ACYDCI_13600 [Candidatus Limnocylindrales bacterium]
MHARSRRLRRSHSGSSATEGETILFVPLTIAVWFENERWLSECLELGVGTFGADPQDAADQAMDAVFSYLNTLEELGERERVFAEKSIAVYTSHPAEVHVPHLSREIVERDQIQIRPFEFPMGFA